MIHHLFKVHLEDWVSVFIIQLYKKLKNKHCKKNTLLSRLKNHVLLPDILIYLIFVLLFITVLPSIILTLPLFTISL